jgi:hypothetical protein
MPGFLIPSDLTRMIPHGTDPIEYGMQHLLASPGAIAVKHGIEFRIPTLVPATKHDGSCKHLNGRSCGIWEVSPFGCAFFDCGPERGELSRQGLMAVMQAWQKPSLYQDVWNVLWEAGKRQHGPEVLRKLMGEY